MHIHSDIQAHGSIPTVTNCVLLLPLLVLGIPLFTMFVGRLLEDLVPISGGRYSVLPNGELHVRNATQRDSYAMYECVSRNIITSEVKASDPATIYVIGNHSAVT